MRVSEVLMMIYSGIPIAPIVSVGVVVAGLGLLLALALGGDDETQ